MRRAGRSIRRRRAAIRILVADAWPLVRSGLRALISTQADLRVVGDAADLRAAARLVHELRADVLILDTALVPAAGQDLLHDLTAHCPGLRIVALTGPDAHHRAFALRLGTPGMVPKDSPLDLVLTCIRSVIAGQYCIAHSNVATLLRPAGTGSCGMTVSDLDYRLTTREEQIVAAIANGSTNKEIAARLSISLATVKHHLTNVFAKTNLPNRLALGTFAIAHHLVRSAT